MKTEKKIGNVSSVLVICGSIFLLLASVIAQEAKSTPPQAEPEKTVRVRGWAVLGDMASKDSYSLLDVSEKARDEKDAKRIFSGVKGCHRTGFGMEYTLTTAGKRKFVLVRDTPSPIRVAEVEAEFLKGAAYTLIAVLDNGVPKLTLVREFPIPPEEEKNESGIYVYNLLTETPLQVQIGESTPRPVPFAGTDAFVIPAVQAAGKAVALIYSTKKRGQIRQELPYDGNGRLSAVFMRNNSSKPSVFVYPSEPTQP